MQINLRSAALTGIVALGLLATGMILGKQFSGTAPDAQVQSAGPKRALKEWDRWAKSGDRIGSDSAPVTLVEFGDFQCPACRQLALTEIRYLRRKYPTDVAIVFHHFPMPYHPAAVSAAHAAECASQQRKFEEIYQTLYQMQDSLLKAPMEEMAKVAGVPDLSRFRTCMADSSVVATIQADFDQAQVDGINETPSLALNGRMLPSFPDSSELDFRIREAMKQAHARN